MESVQEHAGYRAFVADRIPRQQNTSKENHFHHVCNCDNSVSHYDSITHKHRTDSNRAIFEEVIGTHKNGLGCAVR